MLQISLLDKIRSELVLKKLDALIVEKSEDVFYLTGFPSTFLVIIITKKNSYLITDERYALELKNRKDLIRIFKIIVKRSNLESLILQILKKERIKIFGYDSHNTSVYRYNLFKNNLKGISLKPSDGIISSLRIVKTEEEISVLKKSLEVAEDSLKKVLNIIKPGITEKELKIELEYLMMKSNAERAAFDTIIASGENSAVPHHHTGDRKLRKNDMIIIDFGAVIKGYHSDITRTVFIGRPDKTFKKRYSAVRAALEKSIQSVRENIQCCQVDKIARRELKKYNLDKFFTHSLGHGVGLEIHEQPSINPKIKERLKKNYVVTIEPGIYIPNWGGIRIEDMVVVKESSAYVLNSLDHNLICL